MRRPRSREPPLYETALQSAPCRRMVRGHWTNPLVAGFLPLAPPLTLPSRRGFLYPDLGMRQRRDWLGWLLTLAFCTVIVSFLLLAFDLAG
jgi:hypothetical protein